MRRWSHPPRQPEDAMRFPSAITLLLALSPMILAGQGPDSATAVAMSKDELRRSVGSWNTTTEFLNPDGTIARSAQGTYSFRWVVEDRILSGESAIPELGMKSGILFYINEARRVIEMASVGTDGRLWVMTGPMGGASRTTPPFATAGGGEAQLRFTTFNVTLDRFESRMEYTEDGGKTWLPGNHQVFVRSSP